MVGACCIKWGRHFGHPIGLPLDKSSWNFSYAEVIGLREVLDFKQSYLEHASISSGVKKG